MFESEVKLNPLGLSKKPGITVNGHIGLDKTVYQYLRLADMSKPICPFYSYKMGISVVDKSVSYKTDIVEPICLF
jgi:hypothetical protein